MSDVMIPAPEAAPDAVDHLYGNVVEAAMAWSAEHHGAYNFGLRIQTTSGEVHEGFPAGVEQGVLMLTKSRTDPAPVFVRIDDCSVAQPIPPR